jgi:hypothetical protein
MAPTVTMAGRRFGEAMIANIVASPSAGAVFAISTSTGGTIRELVERCERSCPTAAVETILAPKPRYVSRTVR